MRNTILFSAFILALITISYSAKSQKQTRPNIVILYADDMGVADVSCGNPMAKIQTPNIDRLAEEGMMFSDGHSSSGICSPSRFALLTGQHHWRRFHGIAGAYEESFFEPEDFTIAKMFQKQGYHTAAFGKWHLGWNWEAIVKPGVDFNDEEQRVKAESYDWTRRFPDGPVDQGFDYYFGDGTINFPPYCWIENDRVISPPVKPVMKSNPLEGGGTFRDGPMAEDWNPYDVLPNITEKTVEWIGKQKKDEPFFIYLAFNSPHYPIVPNAAFHGTSQAGYYGDFIVETDAMIGKVLAALDENGLSDNTIVIFSADNGAEDLAFSRLEKFGHWSSGEYRGVKRDLYEGGHHVPFIVKWPGQIAAGSLSDEVVNQVDFAATFAAIIDYELANDEAIDSYNLLPVLREEDYTKPLRTATVQNTFKDEYALRQGDWVFVNTSAATTRKEPASYLIHFQLSSFNETEPGLLFNVKDDPRQSKNLYSEYPEKVKQMNALLERYIGGERCAPLRK